MRGSYTALPVCLAGVMILCSRAVAVSAASPMVRRRMSILRPLTFISGAAGRRMALVAKDRRGFLPPMARRRLDVCMAAVSTRAPAVKDALVVVREELKDRKLNAFVIPSGDPHLSEYAADHFCRRAFISGFDGSAGTAVVMENEALLWTDGRYFLQAEQQLGPEWTLMRDGQKGVLNLSNYLKETLPEGSVVGLDPRVHPIKFVTSLAKTLAPKKITLQPIAPDASNPVDVAWGGSRPSAPSAPVRVHPLAYAGESVSAKIDRIKQEMLKEGADVLVACVLDEVAWLLNLRGSDVPNCPLPVSYATVELAPSPANPSMKVAKAKVFVDSAKLTPEAQRHLQAADVEILGYDAIFPHVSALAKAGHKVWLDGDKSNYALLQAALGTSGLTVPQTNEPSPSLISKPSPITLMKALKNRVELECMRACHLRDGAAEVEFLAWLDRTLQTRGVSEIEIDTVLTGLRAKRDKFLGLSFDTIAGAGPNGAIIHYRAVPESAAVMEVDKMLLLDSGAQYEDGTTDVTRTMHFGHPSDFQRRTFTRVLQGHIAIDSAVFPEGTPGFVLDAYARRALWAEGLDYAHGTGHGVGAALNVHEGPQGISFNFANQTPLQPGMVLSNEPGFYQAGQFGIRIENLLVVVPAFEAPSPLDPKQRQYLKFERLTHIPICKKLIVKELLSEQEVEWVDAYHRDVWDKVSPLIDDAQAKDWLREATTPL